MNLPDTICEKHGIPYSYTRGGKNGVYGQRYCNPCRRERARWKGEPIKSHYGGERCHKRGHLKTPWTWRLNRSSNQHYCYACFTLRRKERKQERDNAA